jgi:hypothetical protein
MNPARKDKRIKAIRKDNRVGRGSCAYLDECWGDKELLDLLEAKGITTEEGALSWAYEQEGLIREQGASRSGGEDDCFLNAHLEEWRNHD